MQPKLLVAFFLDPYTPDKAVPAEEESNWRQFENEHPMDSSASLRDTSE